LTTAIDRTIGAGELRKPFLGFNLEADHENKTASFACSARRGPVIGLRRCVHATNRRCVARGRTTRGASATARGASAGFPGASVNARVGSATGTGVRRFGERKRPGWTPSAASVLGSARRRPRSGPCGPRLPRGSPA
jgi:hypothetical protein